jgi:hypothetical protein
VPQVTYVRRRYAYNRAITNEGYGVDEKEIAQREITLREIAQVSLFHEEEITNALRPPIPMRSRRPF